MSDTNKTAEEFDSKELALVFQHYIFTTKSGDIVVPYDLIERGLSEYFSQKNLHQSKEIEELKKELESKQWISVKDRLPKLEEYENYYHALAVVNGETWTNVVFMKDGNKFISNSDTTSQRALDVSHWMDIPKLPS